MTVKASDLADAKYKIKVTANADVVVGEQHTLDVNFTGLKPVSNPTENIATLQPLAIPSLGRTITNVYKKESASDEASVTIKISKKEVSGEKEIDGAKICVYRYNIDEDKKVSDDPYECFTSGNKPHEFPIEPGTYILEEEVTPEGYDKIETGFVFTVADDFKITLKDVKSSLIGVDGDTITLYNTPIKEVKVEPTGKSAKAIYILIGLVFIILGCSLTYLKCFKRKERN